jgi:diadenylate cyclase
VESAEHKVQFIQFHLMDIFDVLAVAFIVYQLLRFIRGTRATQMILGLLVILLCGYIANALRFQGLKWLIDSIRTIWLVAFVILFQPEIRQALTALGRARILRFFIKGEQREIVEAVAEAARMLSDRGIGGLIAIERETGLKGYIEIGTPIDARVSAELLTTIFIPTSPLHDGAVIIRGQSVVAAGCILPLSDSNRLDRSLGTRHRAAVGLTEETDAVCVVVSEETRAVSIAVHGTLMRNLNHLELNRLLTQLLYEKWQPDYAENDRYQSATGTIGKGELSA